MTQTRFERESASYIDFSTSKIINETKFNYTKNFIILTPTALSNGDPFIFI